MDIDGHRGRMDAGGHTMDGGWAEDGHKMDMDERWRQVDTLWMKKGQNMDMDGHGWRKVAM